jgi:O-antigen/teichoic acid export membrane protein
VLTSRRRLAQLWYAPILTISIVVMMARVLVFARLLSEEEFGRFNIGMLSSSTFCMLACVGLQMILQREWPVHLVHRLERHGLVRAAQCNLVALLCAALGAGAALALSLRWPGAGLIALGIIHGLSQQLFVIANFEGRSRGEPVQSASQNFVRAILLMMGGVGAAVLTRSAVAVIWVEASISIVISLLIYRGALSRGKMTMRLAVSLAIRQLPRAPWHSALTLMVVSIVFFLVFNIDRWVAADRLCAPGFAHYAFAWIVLTAAQSAQAVINAAVFPMLARRLGRLGNAAARRFCASLSIAVFLVGALATFPAWWVGMRLIAHWYPQYGDTGTLVLIFLSIAVFRVSDFWSSYLIIVGRERAVLVWNSVLSIAVIAMWVGELWARGFQQVQSLDIAILAAALTITCYAGNVILVWRARLG